MQTIGKSIEIEDLVNIFPEAAVILKEKGIRCIKCGEPIWGSLEEAAKEKGFSDEEITKLMIELNERYQGNLNVKKE
ncbi:MAG: DUF1858 domain-containing protein [Melioribacteraceae bacterium]|nr:DUF1858 domain-containing protein [Melioribacteraceae bacterium]MCF8266421.1 DUF1858 domain-containing protein [Melioribacteraceae bacterium]MCF8414055.1 DUF1858 domain-containing protein [Melioribacteraceae bacterium]